MDPLAAVYTPLKALLVLKHNDNFISLCGQEPLSKFSFINFGNSQIREDDSVFWGIGCTARIPKKDIHRKRDLLKVIVLCAADSFAVITPDQI